MPPTDPSTDPHATTPTSTKATTDTGKPTGKPAGKPAGKPTGKPAGKPTTTTTRLPPQQPAKAPRPTAPHTTTKKRERKGQFNTTLDAHTHDEIAACAADVDFHGGAAATQTIVVRKALRIYLRAWRADLEARQRQTS